MVALLLGCNSKRDGIPRPRPPTPVSAVLPGLLQLSARRLSGIQVSSKVGLFNPSATNLRIASGLEGFGSGCRAIHASIAASISG